MSKELPFTTSKSPKNKFQNFLKIFFEIIYFGFLVGFLIIVVYGFFQKDPGAEFFAPNWVMLYILLVATAVLGIFSVFIKKD